MAIDRRRLFKIGAGAAVAGALGFVVLTSPWTWSLLHPPRKPIDLSEADLANGRAVFLASDCATCHSTPKQHEKTLLGGGRALDTAFGVFNMPNISPDRETGIGNWTLEQFDRALREGVGPDETWPDGRNLYPAFPYTSYQRLSDRDVRDLFGYIMSLPPVTNKVQDHELKFPYNLRRGVGVWRLAFLDGQRGIAPMVPAGVDSELYLRGAYLVEGAGHCAECHSPRGIMGNVVPGLRFAGGPNPEGTGYFPNITPDETGIGFWSAASIFNYLHLGSNPIGRVADGDMAEVIENTAQLSARDLRAIALYIKNLPPIENAAPGVPKPNRTDSVIMLSTAVQARSSLPVTPDSAIQTGIQATVVTSKSAWLERSAVGGTTQEQAKLLGSAQVKVLEREGDRVRLALQGWQMTEAPSIIYQAKGHRIMLAVLTDAAIAAVQRGTPETDPNTGQSWVPVQIDIWTTPNGLNTDRQMLWDYSQSAFQKACTACHVPPQPGHFTANQWIGTMKAMKRFTSFDDDQYRLILAYLQNHSKDLNTSNDQGHGK
ncbi:c-type cytochrome [Cupriavidus metallidurans]|uniref:C-type cytochrome n=1 Tax=Cupriavidus metallidurans TaxID=119219 RepID=A0A482J0H1_9BURK|nr:c-type cytochrome [Cupriavidus metallidurans]QBP12530.1 c-type cytochrome [Cupriavidus metallidurans]